MDISSVTLASTIQAPPSSQTPDAAQLTVLKKANDMQGQVALTLLQSATGNLPLAPSGALGTKVNALA